MRLSLILLCLFTSSSSRLPLANTDFLLLNREDGRLHFLSVFNWSVLIPFDCNKVEAYDIILGIKWICFCP